MDETQNEAPLEAIEAASEIQPGGGSQTNLGDFMRTQGLLKSLRLVLNNQIVVPVEEIASGVSDAGRKLKMGDVEHAHYDVGRLYSAFQQKTNQWESQARNLEQQLRTKAAKDPKSVSIDTMNRMKSEQTSVRTRIRLAEIQFRRLHQGLDQAFTNFKKQSAENSEANATPPGFLAPFKAALVGDRTEIVKKWFEIEAVLKVTYSRSPTGGYKIKFDPQPPLERLYFLTVTAQIILLRQLNKSVSFEDMETGQARELTLKEFLHHARGGVWLLKPAPEASTG